ncbi:hypothetical protein [Noviherbaspirillum denitrificans]|uniref:Uncharacterized protein n=1 Tax=Noviherbaspirillum denitrificans TaxID=1968433 RepID=A0A254TH63_9BURK|nr:hypothetical protein [Noviherbaspirillum denitrificans]OWW19893.1 hypothetical protein AYR66_10640 [Noviherbaspirillum denitrificans]
MATIVIKDLTESIDLDRQAMTSIIGGARTRGRFIPQRATSTTRIVNYPRGFAGNLPPIMGGPSIIRKAEKEE